MAGGVRPSGALADSDDEGIETIGEPEIGGGQEDPPVLGPETVPNGNAALTDEMEKRHQSERRANSDDARDAWPGTDAARFFRRDFR